MNPKIDHTPAYALIGRTVEGGRDILSNDDLLAGLHFKRGFLIGRMLGLAQRPAAEVLAEEMQEFARQVGKLALLEKELALGEHDWATYTNWSLSDRPKIVVELPRRLAQWADPDRLGE